MKKSLLLTLMISLFAVSAWAADVSVTEKFTRVTGPGAINTTTTASGLVRSGDVCNWKATNVRYAGSNDKITISGTATNAWWLPKSSSTTYGKIETTNLEGGIKAVSFYWAQFSGSEGGNTLKLKVKAGTIEHDPAVERDGSLGGNKTAPGDPYTHTFNCKTNGQLEISNISTWETKAGDCRILVGPVTITPYLLYRNKDVTVGLKQRGYANDGKQDFINNTGSEGSIAFSSSNENVATVDHETGLVTPVGIGDAVITATWSEGASTTYTLHVVDGIIAENFSKVVQTGQTTGATWHGDLFDWNVANVRRGEADTLGLNPRIQATALRSNAGSTIISANAIEGGVKHLAFDWRQWGAKDSATKMNIKFYYSEDKETWGDAVASQEVDAATASTPFVFNEDVTGGARNAYLKMEYTADAAIVAVMGALKITPYLLYTTKAATLDTRNSLLYTNNDLINNTTGDAVVYSIAPDNVEGVSIDAAGQVTVTDETEGDFTVTATWGEVTTTYTLTVVSRTATTASFANAKVALNLGAEVPANELTKTAGYDGVIAYASSNTAVATVTNEGVVSLAGGVGQATITATLPQTENYKAASASYNLYVRDNGARIEDYSNVPTGGAVGDAGADWPGVYFDWYAEGAIRHKAGDTIGNAIKVWIGTKSTENANPVTKTGVLASKEEVEGGIKHLSFYWRQWATESNRKLRLAVFAGETRKAFMEREPDNLGAGPGHEHYLFGANDVMRGNEVLSIKNESYTNGTFDGTIADDASGSKSRVIIDDIYITPYLLYTTKERTLDMKTASSCTYTPDIDNTESGSITYSLEDNDGEASINTSTGEVTGIKAGEVTVKATWSEGAFTTYTLTILAKSVTEASYPNAIVRIGLNESVDNTLSYTAGYDGTIAYESSNTAVASVASNGAITINGVGQTTITATLPETENYLAAEASYILQVTDNSTSVQVEAFSQISEYKVSDIAENPIWDGDKYQWHVYNSVRRNNDVFAHDANRQGTWMGTPETTSLYGMLETENEIEGGVKHLTFYWAQPRNTSEVGYKLKPVVYVQSVETEPVHYEEQDGTKDEAIAATYRLFGASNVMRSNSKLIIQNESYKASDNSRASNRGRILLDEIHITPYLLYTDKAERVLRIGETDKNTSLINNTGADASYESSDPTVASIAADGTVTAIARGKVTITAKYQWNEEEFVTTTYPVAVYPVNCETFSNGATASTYAANEESAAGDKATWTARLAGINVGDFEPNVAFIRAPRQGEDKEAYLESSAIAGGIASMTFDWNLVAGEANTNWDIRILINGREVKRLGNDDLAEASGNKMENFAQITIPAINEPDNFTIRFENHSTVNGTYTSGNKARFVIDNICWESYNGTKTLAEDDATNEGWIRANGGQTRTVAITRSALVANVWNTLCLPFAINKADDLGDAEVVGMTNVEQNGDEIDITFTAISGDELAGGMPYLVKPAADKNISGTYSDKQISSIASPVKNGDVTMQGLFSPLNVTANDYNTLFVGTPDGDGNNLFYPQADGQLRGLRAYFKISTPTPMSAPLRRARFVVDQTEVVTGMESVQNTDISIQKIIRDGQLFIIRDGKMYNAQGQIIR